MKQDHFSFIFQIFLCSLVILLICPPVVVFAAEGAMSVPSFFNPKARLDKPDLSAIRSIRFITDDDYPPFQFLSPDGQLVGYNVDLARLICEELQVNCTIQARRWDTLLDALQQRSGDAVIASMMITPFLRQKVGFSVPYYRTPARFVGDAQLKSFEITPASLAGKTVGIISGSAHEEYLRLFFPKANRRRFQDLDSMRGALKRGEVDFLFADAIGLAFFINGSEAAGCCAFIGGPYTESRFFGDGVGIAIRKDNDSLRKAIDYALAKIARDGAFTTLYLKYFPVGYY